MEWMNIFRETFLKSLKIENAKQWWTTEKAEINQISSRCAGTRPKPSFDPICRTADFLSSIWRRRGLVGTRETRQAHLKFWSLFYSQSLCRLLSLPRRLVSSCFLHICFCLPLGSTRLVHRHSLASSAIRLDNTFVVTAARLAHELQLNHLEWRPNVMIHSLW